MDDTNIDMYPEALEEESLKRIINVLLTLIFRTKSRSSQFSVFLPNSFPAKSLHLEVDQQAQFRMQPYHFIRSDFLGPLKTLIDQFVSEGVLILDISCTHASPLDSSHGT